MRLYRNDRFQFIDKISQNTNYRRHIGGYVKGNHNLDTCAENDVELYAKTNTAVAAAAEAKLEEGFSYNKVAHMLQCPSGHLATRVEKRNAQNGNSYNNYFFSVKNANPVL